VARVRIEGTADGSVIVELPRHLRRFVRESAERVAHAATDPSALGHARLMGRVDVDEDHDDPLVKLARQSGVDQALATVAATSGHDLLSATEAEAWLEVLSLALAVEATRLGVVNDGDLERMDPSELEQLRLLQALQAMLVASLSPA
jgi:hypothetical protein